MNTLRIVILLLTVILISGSQSSMMPSQPAPETTPTVISIDGTVNSGEYDYTINVGSRFIFHYSIVRGTLYMALEEQGTGWIAIGWGGTGDMDNYDMVIGGFNPAANSSYIYDAYSIGKVVPPPDGVQNIIEYAASESGGWTTLEFSRLLDTGDTVNDVEIIPGVNMGKLVFGYHSTSDDISIIHTREDKYYNMVFYGPPAAPKGLSASASETDVSLSWSAPAGDGGSAITGYTLYRSENGGLNYSIVTTTTSRNYVDTSVVTGVIYKYKVTANNSNGESGDSNVVTALPLGQITEPQNVIAVANSSKVNISWDVPSSTGGIPVTAYNVFKSTNSTSGFTFIGNTTELSYVDTNVINGFDYYYKVNAQNKYNESILTNTVSAHPVGESTPPENLTIVNGDNYASLEWDAPFTDGGFPIEYYNIYRTNSSGSSYMLIGTNSSANSFVDTSAENGKTYYYTLTAVNGYGESPMSLEQRITIANTPLAPTNLNTLAGDQEVTLTWDAADGRGFVISQYSVYRIDSAGQVTLIATTNETSYTDLNVKNGKEYTYMVSATSEIGESPYSFSATAIPATKPTTPMNVKSKLSGTTLVLTWDKPEYDGGVPIEGYNIYVSSTEVGGYELVGESISRFYMDDSLEFGTTYFYRISALNQRGESNVSNHVEVTPLDLPDRPIYVAASFEGNHILLTWTAASSQESVSFNVYRTKVQGTPYIKVATTNTTSFLDKDFSVGEHYYYAVSAVNSAGESELSDEALVGTYTPPPTPESIVLFASQDGVTIVWLQGNSSFMPADYYMVFKSLDNETYTNIGNTTDLYYIDTDIEYNVTYYYYIVAVNEIGSSQVSEIVYGTPQEVTVDVPMNQDAENQQSSPYTSEPNYSLIGATSGVFIGIGTLGLILAILKKTILG